MEKKKIKVIDIVAPEDAKKAVFIKKEELIKPKEPVIEEKIEAEKTEIKPKIEEKVKEPDIKPKEIKTFDFSRLETKERQEIKKEDIKESLAFAPELKTRSGSRIKKYIVLFFIAIFVGGGVYSVLEFLPRVEIKIVAKKYPFNYIDWITASKDNSGVDLSNRQIPAEIFSEVRNISLAFSAHGKKQVVRKASGEIAIYNSYSSDSQTLIAGTRLEDPDGKIFRLDKKIVIPGAKIREGKIESSSIKAMVTADKAGAEYNIGPTQKFTIPGLKGTPKYDGFYASSDQAMKGGLVGELLYPTEEDLKLAKEKTTIALKETAGSFIFSQIPKEYKVVEDSQQFTVLKEASDKEADESGNFLYSLEGELKIIAFKEFDVLQLMTGLANKSLGKENLEAKEYKLEYSGSRPDFASGRLAVSLNYDSSFWQPIAVETFKNSIVRKKEGELKLFIFSLGSIEKATVSFWPFWVTSVPDNLKYIKVFVE
ncbi:hypothetical protein A2999_02550 [Candidatus Wolfebacteria bacterium RIFCSPLOWO2_01_FULL_38_11]|uniref:GlxA-like beta barrel domain-containing protein n=1 Tax=Candidatus Wolfebacteria bacterium RIFCSPLOWO2_01_FULL_38_11 TaxID=1802556 RepID=A0A1F8DU25_9BACT|nr:MAG: hypothetical protein A2999_02550 [Candidatus Wolfebacteria bacterium RIFCSPLOWO2_01_FULL_38_11]